MEIECKFAKDFWQCGKLEEPEEVLTCIIKSIDMKNRGVEIKAIKGVHSYQLENVRGLEITNTNAEYFPRGLSKLFPNLQFVELSNCRLKEISKRDLNGLENLKILRLPNNKLTSLPDNLFAGMNHLKIIDFSNNKLEHLSSNLFMPVENFLTFANFKNNPKVDAAFEAETGKTLHKLMSIIEESCPTTAQSLQIQQQTQEMVQCRTKKFKQLFETGKFSDLSIQSFDKVFNVHKCILAAQSPVLNNLIQEKFERNQTCSITIHSFSTEAVKDFLYYLYTGDVSAGENIVELLGIALSYEVDELRVRCENIIVENIGESNAFDVFSLGVFTSNEKLKRLAFEELKKDHSRITEELYENPKKVNEIVVGDKPNFPAESVKKVMKVNLPPKPSQKGKLDGTSTCTGKCESVSASDDNQINPIVQGVLEIGIAIAEIWMK